MAQVAHRATVINPGLREDGPWVTEDLWFRVFVLMALVSGFFAHAWIIAVAKKAYKYGVGAAISAKEAAAPKVEQAKDQMVARIPGRIVVDRNMGAGADFPDLPTAIARANDGDVIAVKDGIYDQTIEVNKTITIGGMGTNPDAVWITSPGPRTILLTKGRLTFRNITLSNAADQEGLVAEVSGGALILRTVNLKSPGKGIRVQDGELDASDSTFDSVNTLVLDGKAEAKILRGAIVASQTAIEAKGSSAVLKLERTTIQSSDGSAIEASRFAKVRIDDSTLRRNARAAVVVSSGADAKVQRTSIAENRGCGMMINGGSVDLEQVSFDSSQCGIGFGGPGTADVRKSVFSNLAVGPVALKKGIGKQVVLRGGDNVGLEIPKVKSDK